MALTKVKGKVWDSEDNFLGVNVKDYGATGDGSTDDTAAIQAALTECLTSGKSLYFPSGTYVASVSSGSLFTISGITVYGEGKNTTLKMDSPVGVSCNYFSINGDNTTIRDLILDINGGGSVGILIQNDASDILLENVSIYGTRSLDSGIYREMGIKVGDTSDTRRVTIKNCLFQNLGFSLFTANNFGSTGNTCEDWNITGCTFNEITTGFTLNTDFATSGVSGAWRGVVFNSNVFSNTVRTNSFGGMDGASDITFVGNVFRNGNGGSIAEAALHLENLGGNITITGNMFQNVDNGIYLYPLSSNFNVTGNTLEGEYTSRDLTDDPSTYTLPASDRSYGILLIFDANGMPDTSVVANNTISKFDFGISCGLQKSYSIQGNIISLCYGGIVVGNDVGANVVEDNIIDTCQSGYYIGNAAGSRGYIGKNTLVDCTNLFDNKTASTFFALEGLRWIVNETGALTTGVTTYTAICPSPDRMDTKINAVTRRTSLQSQGAFGRLTVTKNDSSVFAANVDYSRFNASLTVGTYRENSGNFEFGIYQNSGGDITAYYEADIEGFLVWYT